MHYFLFGKGVISEFSYSLDNCEVHQPHTKLYFSYVDARSYQSLSPYFDMIARHSV